MFPVAHFQGGIQVHLRLPHIRGNPKRLLQILNGLINPSHLKQHITEVATGGVIIGFQRQRG